jgi:hypothetical protein
MTTKRPRTRNASTASAAALRSARGGLGLETWIRGHIADTTSAGSVAVGPRLVWPSDLEPEAVGTRRELRTRRLGERLGHGSGAHAPDEYYVIESTNKNVEGFDGAVLSFVQYLYELGK